MCQKRASSKDLAEQEGKGILHDSATSAYAEAPKSPADGSLDANLWSPEGKKRRAKLIAEINAGWSEASEQALSVVAERFFPKT